MSWIYLCAPSIIWTAYWLNSFLLTDSCTYHEYDDCPAWGSCTAECGGGVRSRTCESCFLKLDKDFIEPCNRFCYNGYNYTGGKCQCSDWRYGRCCENCNLNYTIPHCVKNKLQCGGEPDGIRCVLCNAPYYAAGFGKGCHVCPSIHQCKYRRCRSRNNVYCKTCYEDNIIFKRFNNDRECQRMCAWNNHFCWPGRCGTNHLTKECQCALGFRKVEIIGREINSGETSCQPTKRPSIETCNTVVIGPNVEKKRAKSSGKSNMCSYLQDMYGNFQPSRVNFTMLARYNITIPTRYSKPDFIFEYNFGITDTAINFKRQTVSGGFTTLTTHRGFTDYYQSQNVNVTRYLEGKNLTVHSRELINGEAWCLTYQAKGGGFLRAKNVQHTILSAVPFEKQTTERTICYRYDSQPPEHCSKLLTCSSEPLQLDKRITRSTLHHVVFNGWVDPVPRLGVSRTASKIESYEVRVNEVMPSKGNIKVDYTSNVIPSTTVSHTVKTMDINLTANAPRLYCITLEVKDVADNVRQCRRFVLFDNTSSIKIWNVHPFRFTSASPGTNYTWQTHHNDVCLSWKDYFYNNFYIHNELLNPIEPDPNGLINGSYDQITGEIPVSGTSNVYGIIAYNVSWRLNHGSFSEEKPVPSFNNQSICKNLNVKDGDTYTVNVKAIDIVGNTLSDSRTVFIDRSAPHLNNISLEKDGYEVLFVHKSTDLSDMKMTFDAFDPHSGLSNIYWTFGIADTMTELLNEHLGVRTTNISCSSTLCYCPDIGDCAFFRNTLPLNKLQVYVANMGHHYKKYYFTIKVTNMAGLSTTEHINVLVHDSPPSKGVVYEDTTIEEDSESGNVTNAHGKLTTYTAAPEAGPTTCSASTEHGVEWPEAQDGQISLSKCHEGSEGNYYRRCQKGTFLNPVNNCTRKAIRDLHAKVLNGSINSKEALTELKKETNTLTTATENLPTAGDLQNVNQILDEIIDIIEINSSTIESDSDSFFDVANNLLDGNSTSSWKSLIDDKGVGAVSVLTTIDRFLSKVVNSSDGNFTMEVDKPNLFIEIGQVDSCDNIMFPTNAGNTKNTTNSMEDQIVVGCGQGKNVFSGGLFRNMSGMLPTTSNDIESLDSSINGPVLSFSFHRQQNRTENVSITFHVFDNELRDPACSFWETKLSGNSRWSTEGCELEHFDSETGTVSCKCNHLTNFAVLMSPASTTETETVHHRSLGVLSIVGCSISILGLVLTIAIYVYFWRTVRSTRSVLLLNLCTVLVVAYVLFLAGVDNTSQPAVCTSIAVLLHYIFLAAFFLMLSEGCIIAQMVLRPLDKRNILQALLGISYGLPLVVVIISAASSKLKGYGNDKFCWLSIDSGLFWAFAGPALTIIFTNTIITVAVIKRLFGTSAMSKRGDADKIKTGLRSVCVLLPVFGITWLFGVFAVNRDTVVFQYLFVIFNSLQGVLIFVVQCILDRKVQEAFKARRARWLAPEVSITATEMKTKSSAVTKSNATESTA